jgi:hypothetical protein
MVYLINERGAVSAVVAISVAFIFLEKKRAIDSDFPSTEVIRRPVPCSS